MTHMSSTNSAVDGMHCGGCVKSVTRAVSQVPGVQARRRVARAEGGDGRVRRRRRRPAAIVAAIEAAGFDAHAR